MKQAIRLLCLILLCGFYLTKPGIAQNDSIPDNSAFFDDGGISDASNILKVDVLAPIWGNLPVYYERVITDGFALEVGAELALPYFLPGVFDIIGDGFEVSSRSLGFGYTIHPKFYLQKNAPELNNMGLAFTKRSFDVAGVATTQTEFTFNYGLQAILAQRLVLDYDLGVGYRFQNSPEMTEIDTPDTSVLLTISIKLGPLF